MLLNNQSPAQEMPMIAAKVMTRLEWITLILAADLQLSCTQFV